MKIMDTAILITVQRGKMTFILIQNRVPAKGLSV